jgi:hypothetical protein
MLLLLAFMAVTGLLAQTALVTFYSAGCSPRCVLVTLTAGSAKGPYWGPIYDGKDKLVKEIGQNQFVTFRLPAGVHSFAGQNMNSLAWHGRRDNEKRDLGLTLLADQHYYVRLELKDKGVYTIRHYTTILTEHTCSEAFDEAHKTDPLRAKGLDGRHLIEVVATQYFPACESAKTLTMN